MKRKLLVSGALAAAALIGISIWAQRRSAAGAEEVWILALADSYTVGEGVGESGRWPSQVADGLHPSEEMYARWTALIVPSANVALMEPAKNGAFADYVKLSRPISRSPSSVR